MKGTLCTAVSSVRRASRFVFCGTECSFHMYRMLRGQVFCFVNETIRLEVIDRVSARQSPIAEQFLTLDYPTRSSYISRDMSQVRSGECGVIQTCDERPRNIALQPW